MHVRTHRLVAVVFLAVAAACSSSSGGAAPDAGGTFNDSGRTAHKDSGGEKKDDGGKSTEAGKHEDAGHDAGGARDSGVAHDAAHDTGVEASPCAPAVTCPAVDKSCIGLVDNDTKLVFGLRMTELSIQKPEVFASGPAAAALLGGVAPDLPACNLPGTGTFSWLLGFDLSHDTLTTGGALPVTDPTQGYTMIRPTVIPTSVTNGMFTANATTEVDIPVFLDAAGDDSFVLPINGLGLAGTLSVDQDCIGLYDVSALSPADSCQPADGGLAFTPGGTGAGYITLAEADTVDIAALAESLCVLLSGNAAMYGMMNDGSSETVCARDSDNDIIFQGDWCSTTNSVATADCADSMQLSFGFSAASVLIHASVDAGAVDAGMADGGSGDSAVSDGGVGDGGVRDGGG